MSGIGQYLLQCRRGRGRRGRHGGRARSSDRRAVEAYPTKHVYAMGQRAPEDHRPDDPQSGDGPLRRVATDRPDRSVVPETDAQAQQEAHVPQPEVGECCGGSEISRR